MNEWLAARNMLVIRLDNIGTDKEASLVEAVVQQASGSHSLVGETSLEVYAALVERAALVICNDTLPMHLADALATPEVVLFSGTDYEEQWRPRRSPAQLLRRETPCHPCYLFECPIGLPCLDIPPGKVAEAALALLSATGSQRNAGKLLGAGGRR